MTISRSLISVSVTVLILLGTISGGTAKPARNFDVSVEYEEEEANRGVLGVRYAVGVDLLRKTHIIVANVIKGGPAHSAGLRKGDRIIAINNTPVGSIPPKQVGLLMRGDPGTQIMLTVKRGVDTAVLSLVRGNLTELPDRDFQARVLKQAIKQEIDDTINTLCEKAKREYPDIVQAVQDEKYTTAVPALEFVTHSNPKPNTLVLYGLVLMKLGKRADATEILQRVSSLIDDKQTRELVRTLISDYSENKN